MPWFSPELVPQRPRVARHPGPFHGFVCLPHLNPSSESDGSVNVQFIPDKISVSSMRVQTMLPTSDSVPRISSIHSAAVD